MLTLTRKITSSEFRAMDFTEQETKEFIFELINGEIVARNYPSATHQRVLRDLNRLIDAYIMQHQLGEVLFAPFGVVLDDFNDVQPDLMFVQSANQHIIKEEGIYGVPDLVLEVISPSSVKTDRKTKFRLYEDMGVAEYWIVDTKNQRIDVYQWQETGYLPVSSATETGVVESVLLAGFRVNVSKLFA